MARVNVEERFFAERRIHRFAKLLGWDFKTAIGCLVCMWHESQEALRCDGTVQEIGDWVWEDETDERIKVVGALEECGYITRMDIVPGGPEIQSVKSSDFLESRFLIHGNEEQIKSRVQRINASSKGGKATKKKWSGRVTPEVKGVAGKAGTRPGTRPRARPKGGRDYAQCKAIQCSSIQGSSSMAGAESPPPKGLFSEPDLVVDKVEEKSVKSKKKVNKKDTPTDTWLVWKEYTSAYAKRFDLEPAKSAKAMAQIKQIISQVGFDEAKSIVHFYVRHPDNFYFKKGHDIGLCLNDLTGLRKQMLTGSVVTDSIARSQERKSTNMDVAQKYMDQKHAGGRSV